MLRGLYTAASGMLTEQRRHDTVTQNISNINTSGYKQVTTVKHSFPEMLLSMVGGAEGNNKQIGRLHTGVFAEESMAMNVQGEISATQSGTDFYLASNLPVNDPATGQPIQFDASGKYVSEDGQVTYRPEVFFAIREPNGDIGYTKNGSFQVNSDGYLMTANGYQVLDTNYEPIQITGSVDNFKVDQRGRVLDPNTGGLSDVTLALSVIDNPNQMQRQGNGLLLLNTDNGAEARLITPEDDITLRQGYVEKSNVDTTQAMVDMNAALRAYEANQKVLQFYDTSLEKAVTEVGRV